MRDHEMVYCPVMCYLGLRSSTMFEARVYAQRRDGPIVFAHSLVRGKLGEVPAFWFTDIKISTLFHTDC